MTVIWDPKKDFNKGCSVDYWLHSDTMFPVMSIYFQCSFIWFDVGEEYTKASIRKVVQGKEIDVVLTWKGFVALKSICEQSVWNKRVMYLFHNNHYMNIKEYVDIL